MSKENEIQDLQSEIAALKTIVTSLLKSASDEQIQNYVEEVSLNPIHEPMLSDKSDLGIIQSKAQRIARSLVVGIREGRK